MIRNHKTVYAIALCATFSVCSAFAEVSSEEAKQLGGPVLTLFGAERAGNKEGTIPEYKGELVRAPAGYDRSTPGNYPDPWNEKPLYTITAQNADKYSGKLDAMLEIFKIYPNFRMDIYPSHRTFIAPKYILDNTVKNATSCKAVQGGLVLTGCYGGYPFPIPKTGAQVMWNHSLQYESRTVRSNFESWIVSSNGASTLQNVTNTVQDYPFFDPARTTANKPNDIYFQARVDSVAPARKVGEIILLINALDSFNIGNRAYQYIPGQRRVKLAPDLSYDTPSPWGGGGMTMDDARVFLGALDHYDWKLLGKKEKYIQYNNFKMTDYKTCPANVFFTKNFPNPDCVRWELHRVWVVEATLKPGYRHIYKRRVFYFDEDGFLGASGENYDASGKLYRVSQAIYQPFFDGTGNAGGGAIVLDLEAGSWVIQGFFGARGLGYTPISPLPLTFFSPDAIAGEGIR